MISSKIQNYWIISVGFYFSLLPSFDLWRNVFLIFYIYKFGNFEKYNLYSNILNYTQYFGSEIKWILTELM